MSVSPMFYLIYVMMLVGLVKNMKRLLSALSMLEGMMISVFGSMVSLMGSGLIGGLSLMVFLFVVVCEGVMGLSLLVTLSQSWGGGEFFFINLF